MITETISDICTDFQNSRMYTWSCTKPRHPSSVKPCGPGKSE